MKRHKIDILGNASIDLLSAEQMFYDSKDTLKARAKLRREAKREGFLVTFWGWKQGGLRWYKLEDK